MDKKQIRKKYKQFRLELKEKEIDALSLEIANKTLELPIWDFSFYHIFLSIAEQKEVDTEYLLHILQGKDKEIVIPKTIVETGNLQHFLLTDKTKIKKNRWNILEPQEGIEISTEKIEVVFIPLLAFDKIGQRIGYGKGFYDRFLAKCKPEVLKIGLSFFEVEETFKETFSSDVPLNYCVTPKYIYNFNT